MMLYNQLHMLKTSLYALRKGNFDLALKILNAHPSKSRPPLSTLTVSGLGPDFFQFQRTVKYLDVRSTFAVYSS